MSVSQTSALSSLTAKTIQMCMVHWETVAMPTSAEMSSDKYWVRDYRVGGSVGEGGGRGVD